MVQRKNNPGRIWGVAAQTRQTNEPIQTCRRRVSHTTQREFAWGLFGICQVNMQVNWCWVKIVIFHPHQLF